MFPDALAFSQLQTGIHRDLLLFVPELALCVGIVVSLVSRLLPLRFQAHATSYGLVASGIGLAWVVVQWLAYSDGIGGAEAFGSLLRFDAFACFFRGFLLLFLLLALMLTRITGLSDAKDSADFTVLLLGGILGMMLMSSANHLLIAFLAIEMASLPSYVLAGFLKGKSKGSESALKYVVYGAAASGVMLYGISLLAGRFGSGHLPTLMAGYADLLKTGGIDLSLAAGTLFLLCGLSFKLAAVPFHFWLPDVFEGAAPEVGAVLAVASKAAAVALTFRFLQAFYAAFGFVSPFAFAETIGVAIAVLAAITATVGNLAALGQTNAKRLLGYSTIAHAGYMLMALATCKPAAGAALLFYLIGYMLMTLGAFAVVAIVRNRTGSENITAYRGLIARSPILGIGMAIFLLSLLGLPPLAGFAGKFALFAAVYRTGAEYTAAGHPWLGTLFTVLFGVGVLNAVLSAGYYLKWLKIIGFDEPSEVTPLGESTGATIYVGTLAVLTVVAGLAWDPLMNLATIATTGR